jgi:hypothetical protein
MTTTLTIEKSIHFSRRGQGSRKELRAGPEPRRLSTPGRVPRVARFLALAIRFDQLIREGIIENYRELARLGHVSHARVSQIMNLLYLAPDVQEQILFLPQTVHGRDPIHLRQLQPLAAALHWRKQRQLWQELVSRAAPATNAATD